MAPRGKWPPFEWNPADLDNALIGREAALADLVRAFEDVVTGWAMRIQLLVSEYGLGKSRLSSAFVDEARSREPATFVVRVRCPATGVHYRMWDTILRAAFDVPAAADDVEAGALLVQAVERYLPEEAAEVAALIAWLVGYEVCGKPVLPVGADDEALIARCVGALGRLLEAIALERPLLILVRKANHASARDFALASALEATIEGRPIMMVLSGTPELTDHLPGWDRFPVCRLGRLTRDDAERMLRVFFTGLRGAPPPALVARVLDAANGNAFALKSLVRFLVEVGAIAAGPSGWAFAPEADDLEIPDSHDGVVAARMSALDHDERQILGQAALVGRDFWLGALVAIARQDAAVQLDEDEVPERIRGVLAKFVNQRFIEASVSDVPGEEAFSFRSMGHWEAAYGILPATTQQRLHRVIHAWLLLQAGDELEPNLFELARHAEGAGHLGEAADYYLRAARAELADNHSQAALMSLERAHELCPCERAATRLEILFELGEIFVYAGVTAEAKRYFTEALTLAWRMRDRRRGARALVDLARVEETRGEYDESQAHYTAGLRLFEAVQDHAGVALASSKLGRLHWLRGQFERALRCYAKGEEIYRRLRNDRGLGQMLHATGSVHYDRGDVARAEQLFEQALELRESSGDKRGRAMTLNNLGIIWMGSSLERSVAVWQEASAIAEEIGNLGLQATLADNLGEGLVLLGRYDEADVHLGRAVELARITGHKRTLVDALRNQGLLRIAREDWGGAEAVLHKAREVAAPLGLARLNGLVSRALGDLAVARMEATGVIAEDDGPGALVSAEASYRRAAQAFSRAGYILEAARSHERLADMLDLAGRKAEAAEARTTAAQLLTVEASAAEASSVPA